MKSGILRFLAVLLAMAILLAGCTAGNTRDKDEDRETEESGTGRTADERAPEEICQAFFDAYADLDSETTGGLLTGMGDPYSFGELTALLAQRMTVELGEGESNGDYFVIPARIRNIDMAVVFEDLPEDLESQEQAQAWLAESLGAENAAMAEFDVDVYLTQENGEWKVEMSGTLADALLGGYFTMMQDLAGEGEQ